MPTKSAVRIKNRRLRQKKNGSMCRKRKLKLAKARARVDAYIKSRARLHASMCRQASEAKAKRKKYQQEILDTIEKSAVPVEIFIESSTQSELEIDLNLRWHIVNTAGEVVATEKTRDAARGVKRDLGDGHKVVDTK